jgi:alginate O-acetyltransferase complex protein AlgI
MFFNSFHFVAFFAVVCPLVLLLRRKVMLRNIVLLAASYYFYGCWDWRFLSLILISTVVDYLCGMGLNTSEEDLKNPPPRTFKHKACLTVSVLTNLGILVSLSTSTSSPRAQRTC